MNYFFDTSALIKKYIFENGSDKVDELMNQADGIFVSTITEIEAFSTFRRLLIENAIGKNDYEILKDEFKIDYQYYNQVSFDMDVSNNAKILIDKYQLKTLDSIQLGTALLVNSEIDYFVVCDDKLIKSGKKEKLEIINPLI